MATLRPFRQINENDVVNLFALDAGTAVKGNLVKLHVGWKADDDLSTTSISSYDNTVSDRYNTVARVKLTGSADVVFGMLLHDVAEVDENGEKLIWHPRKAHEMQVSLDGQVVPVLTRGIVMVNGIEVAGGGVGEAIAVGVKLYAGSNGGMVTLAAPTADQLKGYVGFCLGAAANGNVLIKFDPRSL